MQKVLITGGGDGIGQVTAQRFCDEGCSVTVVDRDYSSCTLGDDIARVTFDLTEIEKIPDLVKDIGPVDILVNCAGILHPHSFDEYEYPEESKREILRTNLEAPVALMTECSREMIKNRSGRIVNIASCAGFTGHPDIWYGMTKAALINATKSFAQRLGKHSIVVTAVAPGPVHTSMIHKIDPDRLSSLQSRTACGEFATPEQIADIIYWLATTAPDQMTGSCIDANNCVYPR